MEITLELAAQVYGVLRRTAERYDAEGLDACADYAHELAQQLFTDGEPFNEPVYQKLGRKKAIGLRRRRMKSHSWESQ